MDCMMSRDSAKSEAGADDKEKLRNPVDGDHETERPELQHLIATLKTELVGICYFHLLFCSL